MATRYDILTTREGKDGKKFYTRIGVMFSLGKGGFSMFFEALPIPTLYDGKLEVRAVAFEAKPRDGGQSGSNDPLNDEIPY